MNGEEKETKEQRMVKKIEEKKEEWKSRLLK